MHRSRTLFSSRSVHPLAMIPAAAIALLLLFGGASAQVRYFGKEVGALAQLQHGVRGRVFAVDSRTLYLKDFHYDGEGPAAYFYVGSSGSASASIAGATRLRDERGGSGPLRRYRGESITLSLPDGKTLKDYKWFAVYCDEYAVNFGDVSIPREMEYPRPAKVAALRGVHAVSSDPIVVVDAQTLLVPNFSYDGEAPDAKFWVGRGDKPSPQGIRIPDENGKEVPLRKYDKKTIVLTLPGELTVFDIGHFAVWCEAFTVNFGHVVLPRAALANVPPSLKMLGVSPQSRNNALASSTATAGTTAAPARRRRPIARLDATTYRPPARLRPGAGVLTSLLDQPADRLPLHRRADSYTPPSQQLVSIQSSKELTIKEDGTLDHQDYNQQQQQQDLQQHQGLQQQQQQQQQQRHQFQQHQESQQEQQHQLLPQQQEYQRLLLEQQLLQQRQQHIEQQRKLLNDQIYYNQQQQSDQPQTYYQQQNQQTYYNQPQSSQQIYQQQLYEQQRQAYEQELSSQQHQQQQSEEPFQYRLLSHPQEGRA